MALRALGHTGIEISPIVLGSVKFGRNTGVKYPRPFDLPTDAEIRDLLALARELGINAIDTAPAYGVAEQRLGALLETPADWVLISKVGEAFDGKNSCFDFSANATRDSVERSLRRLGRETIDIVLVHSNGDDLAIARDEPVLETLATLKREGAIRAIGMSTKTVAGALWCAEHCDVVMLTLNPGHTVELPAIDACNANGCGVLVKKGFASGHLADRPDGAKQAIEFVLGTPGVHALVVGTINPAHLRANVAAANSLVPTDLKM
ncbi:MAG: aldo/keto reductase [Chromatiales bacterium]|nr:aldo/keto reductase [Chromatiales bacterium]